MRLSGALGKAAVVVSLAAVTIALGACSGGGDQGPSRSASVGTAVNPIKPVSCPERSNTQKYLGKLIVSVTRESSEKLWLMSSDVDCGQWSGKSNPTKLAKVGPYGSGAASTPGITNPFRLEVGSASRPQWRMRMVTKSADGTFKELYSFKLTFAPFPKRSGYRGLFLCFTRDCADVTRVRKCPSTDPKNIDCGFPPEAPRQLGPNSWGQEGTIYRTPAFGGFKPFVIQTYTVANPSEDQSSFRIQLNEVTALG